MAAVRQSEPTPGQVIYRPHLAHGVLQNVNHWMEKSAHRMTVWTGSTWAFIFASLLLVVWLLSGPACHFSDTWQLVMNTFTSIVTFLMVFLIQRSQNKDALAMQIKLNELLASIQGASNRLINVEELSEDEVQALHQRYQQLVHKLSNCRDHTQQASIEETMKNAPETLSCLDEPT